MVVVAVVAGLVMIAPLCSNAMSAVPMGDTGSVAGSSLAAAEHQGPMRAVEGRHFEAMAVMDLGVANCGLGAGGLLGSPFEPAMPGGAFLVCIVIVIAILPILLALWPRRLIHAELRRPAEAVRLVVHSVRQPSLVELCVLRT